MAIRPFRPRRVRACYVLRTRRDQRRFLSQKRALWAGGAGSRGRHLVYRSHRPACPACLLAQWGAGALSCCAARLGLPCSDRLAVVAAGRSVCCGVYCVDALITSGPLTVHFWHVLFICAHLLMFANRTVCTTYMGGTWKVRSNMRWNLEPSHPYLNQST